MIRTLLLTLLLALSISTFSQEVNPLYDSVLAKSLGADEIGMKNYMLVILKTGTAKIEDKAVKDSLFKTHFANMNRLSDEGKLIVAGPFGDNDKNFRGLFIMNTDSSEEARKWMEGDKTITEKIFEVDIIPWYGSAALPVHIPVHDKISKKKF